MPLTNVNHYIELQPHGGGGQPYLSAQRETLTFTFETVWRNRPARVHMEAARYLGRPGEGQSDWRIYAGDARESIDQGLGDKLTDLARTRLGDECTPAVREWLNSDAYGPSETRAYADAIRQFVKQNPKMFYSTPPSLDLRRAIKENAAKLSEAAQARLLRAADAYDVFIRELDGSEDA